jgi:hypothetical protein
MHPIVLKQDWRKGPLLRFKFSRISNRGLHVCEWLRLRNSSPIACVVVQRASRRVKYAGRYRTVVMTLSPHVDVHDHIMLFMW